MRGMLSRRHFIAGSTLTAAALASRPLARAAAGSKPPLRLGLISDVQYADVPAKGTRHYRESVKKLEQAVAAFNARPLDACLHLGDLIDRDEANFAAPLAAVAHCRHSFHHLTGNHDYAVPDAQKKSVWRRLGMPAPHYHVDLPGFRLLMLDTNEVSTYATPEGSEEYAVASAWLKRLETEKRPNAKTWNGAVSKAQFAWFERSCREAAEAHLKVIAFSHHPIFPADAHNAWNDVELLAFASRQSNLVAWFSGHNHKGNFGTHDGIPFVNLKGVVETPDTNAFAFAEVHPDRIILEGHGREPSRELHFR